MREKSLAWGLIIAVIASLCLALHLALARDVEARAPKLATSKWWKEERSGIFIDFNQNARDKSVASAYSSPSSSSFAMSWGSLTCCRRRTAKSIAPVADSAFDIARYEPMFKDSVQEARLIWERPLG